MLVPVLISYSTIDNFLHFWLFMIPLLIIVLGYIYSLLKILLLLISPILDCCWWLSSSLLFLLMFDWYSLLSLWFLDVFSLIVYCFFDYCPWLYLSLLLHTADCFCAAAMCHLSSLLYYKLFFVGDSDVSLHWLLMMIFHDADNHIFWYFFFLSLILVTAMLLLTFHCLLMLMFD